MISYQKAAVGIKLNVGSCMIIIDVFNDRLYIHTNMPTVIIENSFFTNEDLKNIVNGKTITLSAGNIYNQESFARLIVTAVCLKKEKWEFEELEKTVPMYSNRYNDMLYVLENYYEHLISNGIRFGCGYRLFFGKRQYFAYYGIPHGNDDYFLYSEITESEFTEIEKTYSKTTNGVSSADLFKKKYVDDHSILLCGRNCGLHEVVDAF